MKNIIIILIIIFISTICLWNIVQYNSKFVEGMGSNTYTAINNTLNLKTNTSNQPVTSVNIVKILKEIIKDKEPELSTILNSNDTDDTKINKVKAYMANIQPTTEDTSITGQAVFCYALTSDFNNKNANTKIDLTHIDNPHTQSADDPYKSNFTTFREYTGKYGVNYKPIKLSGFNKYLNAGGYTVSCWCWLPDNRIGDWNTHVFSMTDDMGKLICTWNPCNAPWNRNVASIYFIINNSWSGISFVPNYSPDNNWHQLLITVSANNKLTYYLDNRNLGHATIPNATKINQINILNPGWGQANPVACRYLCLFDSEFTSDQVQSLYNEQKDM